MMMLATFNIAWLERCSQMDRKLERCSIEPTKGQKLNWLERWEPWLHL